MSTRLYTISEAAETFRLSIATVKRLVARGALRPIRPTGVRAVRFTETELQRFIAAREADAATSAA